jgi:hypothetical protein
MLGCRLIGAGQILSTEKQGGGVYYTDPSLSIAILQYTVISAESSNSSDTNNRNYLSNRMGQKQRRASTTAGSYKTLKTVLLRYSLGFNEISDIQQQGHLQH